MIPHVRAHGHVWPHMSQALRIQMCYQQMDESVIVRLEQPRGKGHRAGSGSFSSPL